MSLHISPVFETDSTQAATFRKNGIFQGKFVYFPICSPDIFVASDMDPTFQIRKFYTFICQLTIVGNVGESPPPFPVTQGMRLEVPDGTYRYDLTVDPDSDFADYTGASVQAGIQIVGSSEKITMPRDVELVGKKFHVIGTQSGGSGTTVYSIPFWANEVRVFLDGTGVVEVADVNTSGAATTVLGRVTDYGEFVTPMRSGLLAVDDSAAVGTVAVMVR